MVGGGRRFQGGVVSETVKCLQSCFLLSHRVPIKKKVNGIKFVWIFDGIQGSTRKGKDRLSVISLF